MESFRVLDLIEKTFLLHEGMEEVILPNYCIWIVVKTILFK